MAEVSDSTYLWRSYNSTTSGTVATFTNGTQRFFPDGQCPQPAQDGFFQIAAWLAGNPQFVAAENGSQFLYSGGSAGISIGEPPEYGLTFYHWGNGVTYPCGQQFGAVRSLLGTIGVSVIGDPAEGNFSDLSIKVQANPNMQPSYLRCPPYGLPISESFALNSIKPVFTLGNATFTLLYNSTGYSVSRNGTVLANPGFTMFFNVTEGFRQERFLFFWPTASPTGLPSLYNPNTDYTPTYPAEMSWSLTGNEPYLNVTLPYPVSGAWANSISLNSASLCASNCSVGSLLFTGNVSVHATSPLYSLELIVNGTGQGKIMVESPLTIYDLPVREVVSQPLVKGDLYQTELVAVFRDGSTATARAFVMAA